MFDLAFTIFGVDSSGPILKGLARRLGWQPVNEEIFRGAAVLDAVAEIDFEPADTGHALNPRQFRFALLQRAVCPVALVCDLLQMLPQPFCGRDFRKSV